MSSGRWADSDRKTRLPANWASEIVPEVKRLAGNRCQKILPSGKRCPRVGTDVDHVIPNDDHRYSNLRLLCEHHHDQKSAAEGVAGRFAKRQPKNKRPPERHPGLR